MNLNLTSWTDSSNSSKFFDIKIFLHTVVNYMQPVKPYIKGFFCNLTYLLYSKVLKPTLLLVLKPTQKFLLDTFNSNL